MNIKRIAENVLQAWCIEEDAIYRDEFCRLPFDPLTNWSDTGLVLEALVVKKEGIEIEVWHGDHDTISIVDEHTKASIWPNDRSYLTENNETLQEAICKAYLSTLDE